MRRISKSLMPLGLALALTVSVAGCKGRTMENMQPTGDTVEVVPDTLNTNRIPVPVDIDQNTDQQN